MKDMLTQMFMLQDELQKKLIHGSPSDIDEDADRVQFISGMILALTDELHEALNETGWKSWASSKHINEEAFKNELVDAWHFFMNLCLVARMSPEELYIRYLRKREKNIKRQDEGYDGLNKCPICKRAYDDEAVDCLIGNDVSYLYCASTSTYYNDDLTVATL